MPVEAEKNNQKISLYAISIELHFKVGFPTGRDSATFRDKGTEAPSLSRDKGTTGKLKILPRDGTGRDSQNSGWDGPGQQKSGRGRGTKRDRAEKDVLKKENNILKQQKMF